LVALQPTHPQAHKLLAMSLAEMSYFERAASEFEAHVKLEPNDAEAFGRKATALAQLKRFEQAIAAATTAVELAPDRAEAHNNLAWVLERAGKPAAAEASYRRAIELDPKFVMAIGNLAAMCERTDRVDEALSLFERTAEIDPQHLEAQNAVAGCYNKLGDYRAALAAAERALTIKPHDPAARGHRSLTLLAFGRYEEGFAEYEWRWQCKDFTTPEREFTQPRYRGGDVAGRTILVYSEQGYGDNIQFARYLPLLAERGAKVIFECPASLRRLMECVPNASKIIVGGLRPPPFDLQAPLLSLPHAFKTSLETVPNAVPYFKLPANLVESWRQKVESQRRQLNVGLLWRGNTKPNPRRSIPFADLAPLAHQDIAFFSLQVGEQAREAAAAPAGMQLVDFSNEVADFYDLAGLMSNLDMIVTIDSAPAHLAGALGLPTWTLLIKAADWRWLQDRDDSPWYPTMKLIRQHRSDDWSGVVSEVAAALHAKVR
jgi:tetratricopeptide (TPR) repeat protein